MSNQCLCFELIALCKCALMSRNPAATETKYRTHNLSVKTHCTALFICTVCLALTITHLYSTQ